MECQLIVQNEQNNNLSGEPSERCLDVAGIQTAGALLWTLPGPVRWQGN